MVLILLGMVVFPGVIAYLITPRPDFSKPCFMVGEVIVYRKQKASTHPGMRAYGIHASEKGDFYTYLVDKYWAVAGVERDGQIVAVTRTNKQHYLVPDDPNLRKARLTERLLLRSRFPHLIPNAGKDRY